MPSTPEPTLPQASRAAAPPTPARGVVCHLIASNFAGGPEKQIVELSSRLPGHGWTAIVGSFRENRPSVEIIDNAQARGLPTFLIDTRSPFSPASIGQLARQLKQHAVDILVTHGYKPNLVGYLACRGSSTIQVPMVRGYTAEDVRIRLYEAVDRWLLRRFRHVLCVSAATRELLSGYGLAKRRIRVLRNAVDCEQPVEPVNLIREFRLPKQARVIVAAGRLSPEKGHRYLVDALGRLADHSPPIHLVILGSGRENSELRQQIGEAVLSDRVVLGGFRRPILPYLAAADLVVNPSLSEGLPNVVLEALSVKTPVIATDVGGVGEIIAPGQTGWLVPPASATALANAIVEALSDGCRAQAMAENGCRLVADSFSFAGQAARFAQLCADLLPGPSGAADGRAMFIPAGNQRLEGD